MLLTASRIHNGYKWLPEGTVIETEDNGSIKAIHPKDSITGATHYEGVLAPGFVNAHCHLELSHMKGVIPEHTGLIAFLQTVMFRRNGFTDEQKYEARRREFETMLANGIVAVGDICNTNDTLEERASGKMHFHSFVEALGFNEAPQKQFDYALSVEENFAAQSASEKLLRQSIVPHAPYSVSHVLFSLIDKHNKTALLSIHNQECRDEDEYYLLKQGGVQTLLKSIGINDDFFKPSGKSSIQTYLEWLSPSHPFLFIHNTYTQENDVQVVQTLLPNVHWCLCPNANVYIENTLPDIDMLMRNKANICIGTDSLSSNHQLCILSELYSIHQHLPHICWEQLLNWATANGAAALQMQDVVGSFEPGKQPGIVHIQGLDGDAKPTVSRII
ncbi:MAG: amidohydrolase [Sphingobacteriales bacterium]|nr:MAG: amidohydrolase [Sphingobacteriales bacterium]